MKFLATTVAAISLCVCSFYAGQSYVAKEATAAPAVTKEKIGLVPADSKLLLVFANPGEGKEAEFNAYYEQHMQDFMKLPNFVRVQKFEMAPRKGRPDPAYKYLFVWEFTGDQDESFARIQAALKDGTLGNAPAGVVAKLEASNYAAVGVGYRKSGK